MELNGWPPVPIGRVANVAEDCPTIHEKASAMVKGFAQSGFTLIEMLAFIAIVAILMTVAIPSWITLVKDNRITTQDSSANDTSLPCQNGGH